MPINTEQNQDLHDDNRLSLRSEEVQEILGRPPRRIVRCEKPAFHPWEKMNNPRPKIGCKY